MLTRLLDFLKQEEITALLLDLSTARLTEQTSLGISSLTDTWIALRDIEAYGERNRGIYLLKSRGMAHSNQVREYLLTDKGIELLDVYTGAEGVLTGSARYAQEARTAKERLLREQEIERKRREIERKRKQTESAIAELLASFEAEKDELEKLIVQDEASLSAYEQVKEHMAVLRKADRMEGM